MRPVLAFHRSLLAFVLLLAGVAEVDAAVTFRLEASPLAVSPGDTIFVDVVVPVAGDGFNGYDAVLSFDALRLEPLLPTPPAAGEGELFTSNCGLRFLDVSDDGDSTRVRISHVTLCAGLSLTGPGTVYSLAFIARPTAGLAVIELTDETQAYDAGYLVPTLRDDPLVIRVGDTTSAPAPPRVPELAVVPNPFNPATEIVFETTAPTRGHLQLFDVAGRLVRTLHDGPLAAGPARIRWNGRDDDGRAVATGLYFARLSTAEGQSRARLVLLR